MRSILTPWTLLRTCILVALVAVLPACSGDTDPDFELAEDFSESALQVKLIFTEDDPAQFGQIVFGWNEVDGATSYRFLVDLDGPDGDGELDFELVEADIPAGLAGDDPVEYPYPISPHLLNWADVRFLVETCDADGCVELGQQVVRNLSTLYVSQLVNSGIVSAYADNVDRIIVGSPLTSLFLCDEIVAVPPDEIDDFCQYSDELEGDDIPTELFETITLAGAASVFALDEGAWLQEALLKASNIDENDNFGVDVAFSDDGNTVVVSATGESSNATGVFNGRAIDGGGDNNDEPRSGAAYIFTRQIVDMEPVWTEVAYLKPQNTQGDPTPEDESLDGDQFGSLVAISGDGLTVAVSAFGEDSSFQGIGIGDPSEGQDNDAENSGAVYVYRNVSGTWVQEAYIKASNSEENDAFGSSLSFSDNGDRLAVGAIRESSSASGVNGDRFNNGSEFSGAAYLFERSGSMWTETTYFKASDPDPRDEFGFALALNGAGRVLVVSAPQEDSSSREINGDPTADAGSDRNIGAAYVFERSAGEWSQTTYLKANNADPLDEFGFQVALTEKDVAGETELRVLVTSVREGGVQSGINPNGDLDSFLGAGAGYLYIREGDDGDWRQQAYIKAPNNAPGILFGWDADFAADGDRLLINSFGNSFQSATTYIH